MRLFLLFLVVLTLPSLTFANDQCSELQRAVKAAEELRGLKRKTPVHCKSLSKEALSKVSDEYLFILVPRDTLSHLEQLYKAIGLIEEDFDYARCYLQESNEYAQAFYQIFDDTVYLPNWKKLPFDMLVHEAVHAIQNEHFPLKATAKKIAQNTDQSLGYMAVIEGDARRVQARYRKENPEVKESVELPPLKENNPCQFSYELESVSYFPYEYGELFVSKIPEEELSKYLEKPPMSSAAVIHPKLYKLGEPKELSPDLISQKEELISKNERASLIYKDQIGQFVIRMILTQFTGRKEAILASIGWRGDTAYLYESKGGDSLIWVSTWSNEADAKEFSEAFSQVIAARTSEKRKYSIDQEGQVVRVLSTLS